MFQSYFRISYRNLTKRKGFAIINILGLSIGMAAALLIFQYTSYEKGFDSFHTNLQDIYRVTTVWNKDVTPEDKRATTVPWSGPGPKEAFSEIEDYSRFAPLSTFTGEVWVQYETKIFAENRIFLSDPGFLRIFTFPLIAGDRHSALSDPFSVVLTESTAKRFFGAEEPLGKSLTINTHGNFPQSEFKVTGVIRDPPAFSHLQFDFLVSYNSIWPGLDNGSTYWHWDYTYCYLLLNSQADAETLEQKISQLRVKQFGNDFGDWNDAVEFKLQPLKDIHLSSSLKGELTVNGDGLSIYFLTIIGIGILISAYLNYINLATVKAVERKTEIGLRKIVGSTKWQLTAQLLVESVMLNLMAAVLAMAYCFLCQPLLFAVTGARLNFLLFLTPDVFVWMGIVLVTGIILSSLYPVLMLTSFKPAQVLKGGKVTSNAWIDLRKSLIVVQFIFCIGFTVGTYTLYQQLRYMKNADIGMNINQVLVVRGFGAQPYSSYENFKTKLEAFPFVQVVGRASSAPGEEITNLGLRARIAMKENKSLVDKELKLITVDGNFFEALQVEFLKGRNFGEAIPSDKEAVIVNEAGARLLGYHDPGDAIKDNLTWARSVMGDGQQSRIIGVIRNYHQLSLKNAHEPLAFIPSASHEWQWNKRYYFIRFQEHSTTAGFQSLINSVEHAWKSAVKDEPFNYFFLDQYYDRQYKFDAVISFLLIVFSVIAIVIACLGLFGLVSYTTLQRTREIGVRKVLGASVRSILVLLSKDFVRLMMIAITFSVPFMIWGIRHWLNEYAFRIELTPWIFALPVAVIFLIALLTVMLKSFKVATRNPVDSLRYE